MPADNSVKILPSPDVLGENIASDYVGGAHYQQIKVFWGANNVAIGVDDLVAQRFPALAIRHVAVATASVANGGNVSTTVDCRGFDPVGIEVPSTFDGTIINFRVSMDNSTFQVLYDMTNTLVQMTVTAGRSYPLWGELAGWSYIQVTCGTAQSTTSTDFRIQLRS